MLDVDARHQIISWMTILLTLRTILQFREFDALGTLYWEEALEGLDGLLQDPYSAIGYVLHDNHEANLVADIGKAVNRIGNDVGQVVSYHPWVTNSGWRCVEQCVGEFLTQVQRMPPK